MSSSALTRLATVRWLCWRIACQAFVFGWALTVVPTAHSQSAPLACDRGSIEKVFGGTRWLVYSCNDGRSVVLVSAPGSPASPFYFMFSPENGSYNLRGEGTGNKAATDAAVAELKKLVTPDIVGLLRETLASPGAANGQ